MTNHWNTNKMRCDFPLGPLFAVAVVALSGCSVFVEDTLKNKTPARDAGMDTNIAPDAGDGDANLDSAVITSCTGLPGIECDPPEGIAAPYVCDQQGACVLSVCGDGFVDMRPSASRAAEQCDDRNTVDNDGCSRRCQIEDPCDVGDITNCSDGNPCTIEECLEVPGIEGATRCSSKFVIDATEANTIACDAVEQRPGRCNTSGECIDASCQNGALDAGEECDNGAEVVGDGCSSMCKFECNADTDCGDGNACNTDRCAPVMSGSNVIGKACVHENPTVCPDLDGSNCTIDRCDPSSGNCIVDTSTTDVDQDGYYTSNAAVCTGGNDCDDTRREVHPMAAWCGQPGDDLSCGTTASTAVVWVADCDCDGFTAANAVQSEPVCARPTTSPPGCNLSCSSQWVASETKKTDCLDIGANAGAAYPGQIAYRSIPRSDATSGSATAFDWDCNGRNDREIPILPTSPGACTGLGRNCGGPSYVVPPDRTGAPFCGAKEYRLSICALSGLTCVRQTRDVVASDNQPLKCR